MGLEDSFPMLLTLLYTPLPQTHILKICHSLRQSFCQDHLKDLDSIPTTPTSALPLPPLEKILHSALHMLCVYRSSTDSSHLQLTEKDIVYNAETSSRSFGDLLSRSLHTMYVCILIVQSNLYVCWSAQPPDWSSQPHTLVQINKWQCTSTARLLPSISSYVVEHVCHILTGYSTL